MCKKKTEQGHDNLIYAISLYLESITDQEQAGIKDIYEDLILPRINTEVPAESYHGINQMNLKTLAERIRKAGGLSVADFYRKHMPLITEPLSSYLRDICGMERPLWGAWYLAYQNEDPYKGTCSRVFSENERRKLWPLLLDPEAGGETAGYALCVLAGLTLRDAMNARYRDLYELEGYPGTGLLHVRGSFPKRGRAMEYDVRPRFAVLPGVLYRSILARKASIEANHVFPVITDERVYKDSGELPIACCGTDISSFCSMYQLDSFAQELLRCEMAFDELRASYINRDLLAEPARYAAERSMAYSMGRLDYAAWLHAADVSMETSAYLFGLGRGEYETSSAPEVSELHEASIRIEEYVTTHLAI